MRRLLILTLCGLAAGPGAALAQDLAPLTPLPVVAPTSEPVTPASATPAPPTTAAVAPPELAPTTSVVPVLHEAPEKSGVGAKVGTVVGGVAGGLAGAAVAGPVGKFAGGFVGKRLAGALLGRRDEIPQVTVAQVAPSAEDAAAPAAAERATAPSLETP